MRVLSIVHEPTSTGGGGLFEDLVVQRGDRLDRWVTVERDAGPDAPERYDAIMVFGGAMHPDQDAEHPWLAEEAAFIRAALDREVPLLGVCLGAQLIARAAGAKVGPAGPRGRLDEVRLNDAGRHDPVIGVLPPASTPSSGTTTPSSCRRAPSCSPRTTRRARPSGSASAPGESSSTPR